MIPEKTINVLAIDGGGVRGIMPARILEKIEKETKTPTSKIFDLVVGTSTGGILAAALTAPSDENPAEPKYSAEKGVEFYRSRSIEIFPTVSWWKKPYHWIVGTADAEYNPADLLRVTGDYLGNARLRDSLTHTLIPSLEITRHYSKDQINSGLQLHYEFRQRNQGYRFEQNELLKIFSLNTPLAKIYEPKLSFTEPNPFENPASNENEGNLWYFTSWEQKQMPGICDSKLTDTIRCATAAPTYFSPMPMTFNEKEYAFIDAGVSVNNPAIVAYTEAKHLFQMPDIRYNIVSLGTGICEETIPYSEKSWWGEVKWSRYILQLMLQSQCETVEKEMTTLFDGSQYFRFQTSLEAKNYALDNADAQNLQELLDAADETLENESDTFNQMIEKLDVRHV